MNHHTYEETSNEDFNWIDVKLTRVQLDQLLRFSQLQLQLQWEQQQVLCSRAPPASP